MLNLNVFIEGVEGEVPKHYEPVVINNFCNFGGARWSFQNQTNSDGGTVNYEFETLENYLII